MTDEKRLGHFHFSSRHVQVEYKPKFRLGLYRYDACPHCDCVPGTGFALGWLRLTWSDKVD